MGRYWYSAGVDVDLGLFMSTETLRAADGKEGSFEGE